MEEKNKSRFDYKTYAKITISTNQLPITKDRTDGYYRRWILVKFPNQFKKKIGLLGLSI